MRTLALMLLAAPALATPVSFTHQGRYLDALGNPLNNGHGIVRRMSWAYGNSTYRSWCCRDQ